MKYFQSVTFMYDILKKLDLFYTGIIKSLHKVKNSSFFYFANVKFKIKSLKTSSSSCFIIFVSTFFSNYHSEAVTVKLYIDIKKVVVGFKILFSQIHVFCF